MHSRSLPIRLSFPPVFPNLRIGDLFCLYFLSCLLPIELNLRLLLDGGFGCYMARGDIGEFWLGGEGLGERRILGVGFGIFKRGVRRGLGDARDEGEGFLGALCSGAAGVAGTAGWHFD